MTLEGGGDLASRFHAMAHADAPQQTKVETVQPKPKVESKVPEENADFPQTEDEIWQALAKRPAGERIYSTFVGPTGSGKNRTKVFLGG
jgi:hypothetical protein